MLEGFLADAVGPVLEKYIVGFTRDNLHLSTFSGRLALQDLVLNASGLNDLGLPVPPQLNQWCARDHELCSSHR